MASLEKTLVELQNKLAQELVDRIKKGKAKPADLAVARQLLKDNNIDLNRENLKKSPLRKLGDVLPFQDPETNVAANQ